MKEINISLEDVLKDKQRVRRSQNLADAFVFYFKEYFDEEPSLCCTFNDFHKLKNVYFKTDKKMNKKKKYHNTYPASKILWYKKNKRTYRSYAGKATDDFIEEFLEYHDKNVFDDVERFVSKNSQKEIKALEDVKENFEILENLDISKTSVKELLPIIHSSDLEELARFENDERATIVKAVNSRREDLLNG